MTSAGVLHLPGHMGEDYRPPTSTGSDRTMAAGGSGNLASGVMLGSYPAGYSQIPTQMSAQRVDIGSQRSVPGGFYPPTAGSPPPTSPALRPGSGHLVPSGSYQIPSSGKLASGSYPAGSYPIGSTGSLQGAPHAGTNATLHAGVRHDTVHGLHSQSMGSYPAGSGLSTVPGGIRVPDTIHSLHGSQLGTQQTIPNMHGSGTGFSTQQTIPNLHGSGAGFSPPGSHQFAGGAMTRPGSGGGQISSAGTLHDLHRDSADAYFLHGPAPGSAQSAGTMHDLHPGYRPDHGYSPPSSHQQQDRRFGHQLPPGQLVGKLSVRIIAAFDLKNTDLGVVPGELSDPFVVIRLGDQEHKTDVVRNNLNPVFNSPSFEFSVPSEDDILKIEVFNASQFYAHDTLGTTSVSLWHIVTNPGVVIPTTAPLEDGGRGRLEYEVYYLPPERMGTMAGKGKDPPRGQILPFVDLQVQRKPVQHMVPLPDFHSFGPAAFVAPPREPPKATAGEVKRKAEYESWACHMGQYDYEVTRDKEGKFTTAPVYFPSQEPTDRHAWKQDPFYRALDDADRSLAEGGAAENKDPFQKWIKRDGHENAAGKCAKCGNTLMSDARFCRKCGLERSQSAVYRGVEDKAGRMELWQKDPFSDWLRNTKFTHDGMRSDQIQEAKLERKMLALPSFKDDVKRFGDNRDYANLQDVAQNCRPRVDQDRYKIKKHQNKERLWQEDAFYDWLPDHGGGDTHMQKHTLHPPLENARMARLPSFSEDRFLGLQGKGIGVLKVWVKHAMHLQYQLATGEWIDCPSACVLISCGPRGQAANSTGMKGKKPTPTIEHSSNPVWNAGPFQFEVMDEDAELTLEVMDLLGQAGEDNLFLGRVVKSVQELHGHEAGVKSGVRTELLDMGRGSDKGQNVERPKLSFEVLFQPYNKSFDQRLQRPLQSLTNVRDQRPPRGCIGQICVHQIRATRPSGQNGGWLNSTVVKTKLRSEHESQLHVTDRCRDGENPLWDLRDHWYTFNIQQSNDDLELAVYDEQGSDPIGIVRLPVALLLEKVTDGRHWPIEEVLKDVRSGQNVSGNVKMEVTISVLPGDHSAAAPYHRSISQSSRDRG